MSTHAGDYPDLLVDLATILGEALQKQGVDAVRAADVAFVATEHVRKCWSGQMLYLPKGTQYELSQRDQLIWQKFNGHNHYPLAVEFGLTEMRIYQILKRVHAAELKRVQPDLFAPPAKH